MPARTRNTRQKTLLLKVLRSQRQPRSAEEIHSRLARTGSPVCLSTVYRNLDRLTRSGVVRRVTVGSEGRARFELARRNHHHHVVCSNCSRVVRFDLCPLDGFVKSLQDQTGFRFDDHTLEISGLCQDCR